MKSKFIKKDYFNHYEFMQALSIEKTDPYEALNRYKEYLEKYPEDYTTYTYYATLLITVRKFDDASRILDKANELVINDIRFHNNKELFNMFIINYNFTKIKLLLYQKKYDELYKQYIEHIGNVAAINYLDLDELLKRQTIQNVGIKGIKFMCWKKLGKMGIINRDKYSYLLQQVIDYRESDFLKHIEKHMMDYNTLENEPNVSVFVTDFNIDGVLAEVKKYIPSELGLCSGFLEDIYTFKYDECGRVNNKMVNYFQVVAFHDTCDLITMYPTDYGEFLPYTDLNYMNKTNQPKVKRKSQIDKFNQRFGIK